MNRGCGSVSPSKNTKYWLCALAMAWLRSIVPATSPISKGRVRVKVVVPAAVPFSAPEGDLFEGGGL